VSTLNEDAVQHGATAAANLDVVFDLVANVEWWNTFHGPSVHAEPVGGESDVKTYQHWWIVDDHTVKSFTATWRVDREARTIGFDFAATDGRPAVSGRWSFTASGDDTTVTVGFEPAGEEVEADLRGLLDAVVDAADRHAARQDLVVDFEDPLFVSGPLEPAYDYLYDCAKWPERIPHVVRLDLEEPVPNIQFFDMDTHTPDGVPHTTRSVRICLPGNKIVYKQIGLPALLDGHTGHWRFTPTREGVWLGARHTAVIKPSALRVLGEGTTVEDARRYLRKVLGTNSMGNLRFAKQHAEERA
jgi:C7-C12 aromatase (ARO/CYC)